MRASLLRDLILVIAAILGFHALFVSMPARLAREEPSLRVLKITAPDCATFLRTGPGPRPGKGFRGGLSAAIPAAPIR